MAKKEGKTKQTDTVKYKEKILKIKLIKLN